MDIKATVIEEKHVVNEINQKDSKKINNNYIEESISDDKMSIDNNRQTTTKAVNDDVSDNNKNNKDHVVEGRVDNNKMKTVTTTGEEHDHVGDV